MDDITNQTDNSKDQDQTAASTDNSSGVNQATVLVELENLIKGHITNIEKGKGELSKFKEMLDSIFANDETFKLHSEKAKEANKIKSATKQEILKQQNARELSDKIKSLKSELDDLDSALSDYLREYQRMSGSTEIEGDDGEMREIIYTARLVKKSQYRP